MNGARLWSKARFQEQLLSLCFICLLVAVARLIAGRPDRVSYVSIHFARLLR